MKMPNHYQHFLTGLQIEVWRERGTKHSYGWNWSREQDAEGSEVDQKLEIGSLCFPTEKGKLKAHLYEIMRFSWDPRT